MTHFELSLYLLVIVESIALVWFFISNVKQADRTISFGEEMYELGRKHEVRK